MSALTHLAGAVMALMGLFALLARSGSAIRTRLALIVYGVCLVLLFTASGIYHAVQAGPRVIGGLRKVDHAAIYLLIAGTYTPFCVLAFRGFWQWGLLAIIWGLALAGILVKVWFINAPRWMTAGVYVVMGWLVALAVREMIATLSAPVITWLVIGGVTYTLGAAVYATKRMDFFPGRFGFHEVWHIFVLLGAAAHYVAVFIFVGNMH